MRHERGIVYLMVLGLLVLIAAPYVYAWRVTPAGEVYTGLLWLPDDQNVHLTWAKQAMGGRFLFPNLYSADGVGKGAVFSNVVMWWVGVTARVIGAPLILVYHGYRLAFAAGVVLVFHRLMRVVSGDGRVRVAATFLVAFSAGWGWVPVLLGRDLSGLSLMDLPRGRLFVPEAYTWTSGLIYPLNVASVCLIGLVYWWVMLGQRTGKWRYAVGAGVAAMVLGNAHTYDSVPLVVAISAWGVYLVVRGWKERNNAPHAGRLNVDWGRLGQLVLVVGMAGIPMLIQARLYLYNEEFRWSKTHYPVMPLPVGWTALSFGPLVPLAGWGMWVLRGRREAVLMGMWAGACLGLMYWPGLDFGRKLVEGVQLPLAYLAAEGLGDLVGRLRACDERRGPRAKALGLAGRVGAGVVLGSAVLSVPFVVGAVLRHRVDTSWPAPRTPLDLPAGYAAAIDYFDRMSAEEKAGVVVLAMPPLANHIPPRAGVRVYVGHWAESIRFVSKFWTAHGFFSGMMSEGDVREFLAKNHVTHVVVAGEGERRGWGERVGEQVLEEGGVEVWRVGGSIQPMLKVQR